MTYAWLQLTGDEQQREDGLKRIHDRLRAPGLQTEIGGVTAGHSDLSQQIRKDLARAESLSAPVLMILLVVVFGSVVGASPPLAPRPPATLGAVPRPRR